MYKSREPARGDGRRGVVTAMLRRRRHARVRGGALRTSRPRSRPAIHSRRGRTPSTPARRPASPARRRPASPATSPTRSSRSRPTARTPAPARSRRTSSTATSSRSGSCSSRTGWVELQAVRAGQGRALRARLGQRRARARPAGLDAPGLQRRHDVDDARHAGRPVVHRALPDEAVPGRQRPGLPVLPARHHAQPRRRHRPARRVAALERRRRRRRRSP